MLWRVTVQREDPAKPQGFSPSQRQTQVGDAAFWFNEDASTQHQPVPDTGQWNIPVIDPDHSSDQLALNTAGTFSYHCAIHPDEKAEIVVANAVLIAAGADPLFGSALTINPGQCVSWGNADASAHQPCPDAGDAWFKLPIEPGDLSAPISFADAGTINYHCAIHPNETGQISVVDPTT
jgi:plastocyanin